MILQALVRHYEDLAALNECPKPGWQNSNISFVLCINRAGELERVVDVRLPQEKGKPKPQSMCLPSYPTGRTSTAVRPAFLWDNAKYLLGIDNDGKQSSKYFEGSRAFHQQLLDGVNSPVAQAIIAFYDHWNPAHAGEHPALADAMKDILSGANMVFRCDGRYAHTDPLIQKAWQDYYTETKDGPEMVCLVTGKQGPIERLHPSVKKPGDPSWSTMGNTLVGFNAPAFCSYGKEQSLNAPTGKYAAFAYTSALNHMLEDRDHLYRIGDTTVLCWAEGGEPAYRDAFAAEFFGSPSPYNEHDLRDIVEKLLRGDSAVFSETLLDPNRPFYVLGLAPNAARLSVRFFLQDSFGAFLQNVQRHHQRLEIVKPSFDKFDTLPLWRLLGETVNQNSRDKSASPNMAGTVLRAILLDEPYPATLLNGVMLRIRAEREVTRGRAAILKAYYLKLKYPHPDVPKEVLTVSLNPDSTNIPYTLGRLFSVLEDLQRKANDNAPLNTTIKDRYFNAASTMPDYAFTTLLRLAEKHLKKLKADKRKYIERQIRELMDILPEKFPTRLNLPQQGSFLLGYYHQTQKRYEKKEEKDNV